MEDKLERLNASNVVYFTWPTSPNEMLYPWIGVRMNLTGLSNTSSISKNYVVIVGVKSRSTAIFLSPNSKFKMEVSFDQCETF